MGARYRAKINEGEKLKMNKPVQQVIEIKWEVRTGKREPDKTVFSMTTRLKCEVKMDSWMYM